ncbi:unnamed protein product, partial [Thlaspi arvense]
MSQQYLQLLSSPPMAVNSKIFTNHRFTDASFLTAGGFSGKRNGFAVKPTAKVKLSVKSRQEDYFEKQRYVDSSSSPPYSPQNAEGSSPRFYVGHSIYKGKAALTIEPRAPEFVFSLSVSEIGNLVSLGPRESCEFFHDPNKGKGVYIPITKAEFAVLVSAFNFILPHLIGWQAFANSIKPEDSSRLNNASPKYGGDYEWSR